MALLECKLAWEEAFSVHKSFFILLIALIAATGLCVLTDVDIRAASMFYQPDNGFPLGKMHPWKFLYRYGEYPSLAMGAIALLLFGLGYFKPTYACIRRQALFLALLLIIAPGILVNAVFKDHWGRPRPRHLEMFGGTMSFHQPWQPGPAPKNASFPAGHPAVAFYMSAPYFIFREKKRRQALLWLWGGILYGIFMGIARVIQGGHFVTDVIWSAGFVYLSAMILVSILKLDRAQEMTFSGKPL